MGQSLAAKWHLSNLAEVEIDGLEASVLWYTEGKGDEDQHIHHFRRWSSAELAAMDLGQSHGWDCQLPLTPLSYEGTLLRIRWCVRLRLFCSVGPDSVAQVPFQLLPDVSAGSESDSPTTSVGTASSPTAAALSSGSLLVQSGQSGLVARVGQLYRRRAKQRAGRASDPR